MKKSDYYFMLLAEEAAEIAQAALKCVRFTPEYTHEGLTNLERLRTEIADLMTILDLLELNGINVIGDDMKKFEAMMDYKIERLEIYTNISKQLGVI